MTRFFSSRLLDLLLVLVFAVSIAAGCASSSSPLDELKAQLQTVPEYSIILEDMREDGFFLPVYLHKYKVLQGEQTWSSGWREVSEDFYRQNENFLGMTLASKTAGQESATPHPAGYNYVGNEKYGQWKSDNRGNSFWEFYGQYALLRDVLGLGGRTVFRNDYDQYRGYQTQNRPYYGPTGNEYGTTGTVTKQRNPNFFERRRARDLASQQRFRQKFQSRVGRSSASTMRSRSFGFGK